MKILRLELQGFKSFKDKTIIHFDQPITAIVGSNGCGKSNVVDALYWVMGDMSPKHLRGSQMTDVIFSGTRNTQAMDMAEVTLVMERNPETDPALPPQFQTMNEVQITRRYYRHGESEYFINRVNCRLRDIQEFFMDTGIGAKSYSIIEQGAITRMVAQKPEERRVVLEDVAGITKFKARRAETERKLEQSNLNLQRVDDLVKDLQKQLGTLQRQAEKAQKFKEWSDELRNLEIRVAGKDWTTRRDRLSQSKNETENTSQKLTTLEAELHNSRAELQKYRESFEALEQDLAYLRSSRQENELKIKEKEGQIQGLLIKEESLVRRRERDEQTKKDLTTRKEELDLTLNTLATDLLSTEGEVSSFIQKIEELRTGIDQIRNEYEVLRAQVDASRRDLHVQDLAITKLSQEIQVDQKQTLQLEDRQQVIEETRVDIEREFISKTNERSGAERLLQDAFAERKDLEGQKENIDQRIQGYEHELAAASDQLLKAQEDLTRDRVRHSHLHELDKNLEGIGAASRSLAMHMREQGHLSPLIADQVKVPQLLERAVEAAFSDLLETVVVEKSTEAEELLNYLKASDNSEAKSTRIKFFIKDFVRSAPVSVADVTPSPEVFASENAPGPDNLVNLSASSQLSSNVNPEIRPAMTMDRYLREHPAVVGRLDELLTQEGVIPTWAQNYGHWWVVRDRSAFENLRPSINNEVTLVSLEGDLFYPNGFVDYAPFEESDESVGHLVQRRRELQELKLRVENKTVEVEALHSQVDTLKKNLSSEREAYKLLTQRLVALNPGLQKHTDLIRDLEGQVARLSEKKDSLSREFEQNSEKLETLKSQLEERNERLIDQSSARKSYEDALNENLEQLKLVELRNRDKSQELESQQKLYNDLLKKLTTQKTEQASLLQEKNLSDSRIQQLDAELVDIASLLEQLSVEQQELQKMRQQLQVIFEEVQEKEIHADSQVKNQRKLVTEFEGVVAKTQEEVQKEFERLKNLEQDTAVNEVEIRNIEERMQTQYQLKFEEMSSEDLQKILAPSDFEEDLNPELNREKVERLRAKIDRLGKINMVAMEEYQELGKRYEYLFVQRQDLSEAIKSLYDAIARIDQESRERFREAYESVNQAFKTTFPLMFGGGQAELKLTDPDNLLESGVEIVAQPPGKKLQSVTLLSGGEKALTAVSLVFGIFSIKPSPFAVLDEVDAPLDDTNVGRFNQQVRRMCENSQIILITHHKQSMESADALYGVTMEEPGISKIASARLGKI